MDAVSILLAILALGFLIVVHEAGHYVVARWCKMRVERFSVGFGPGILKRKGKSGTIFQLAPLPFGGFVEIRGMNIAEEVDPEDLHAYPNRPAWQRFLTILAGPATNYISAIFLAFALYTCHGQKGDTWYVEKVNDGYDAKGKLLPNDRIIAVDGVPMFSPSSETLSAAVNKKSGQLIGITVLRANGAMVTVSIQPKLEGEDSEIEVKLPASTLSLPSAVRHDVYRAACQIAAHDRALSTIEVVVLDQLRVQLGVPDDAAQKLEAEHKLIRNNGNRPASRPSLSSAARHDVYRAACQIAAFDRALRANEVVVLDKLRIRLGLPDDAAQKLESEFGLVRDDTNRRYYRIGVTQDRDYVSVGFTKAVGDSLMYPVDQTKLILSGLRDIFAGKEDADPGGPIRIIGEFKSAFSRGLADGVMLLMMLSVYLGLFNLFPLPALDGGRLVFLLYEMVTRRRANPKIETMVHMGGIMVLMVVMILVTLHDFKVF